MIAHLRNLINKHPPVFSSLFLIAGILCSSVIDISVLAKGFILILEVVFLLLAVYSFRKFNIFKRFFTILYPLSIFLFGFFSFQNRYWYKDEEHIGRNNFLFNRQVVYYGTISELPETKQEQIKFILDCDSVYNNGITSKSEGTILITIYKTKYINAKTVNISYGDYISICGVLEELKSERNPGEFDYGKYLKLHGIDATMRSFGYDKINVIGKTNLNPVKKYVLYPFKKYASGIIEKLIGGQEAQFLKGLVLGDRSNISKQVKDDFINAGVAHIIAVSGLNVAYMLILLNVILMFFPIKHVYKFIITLIFLYLYSNLTGNPPSIVRASVMAGVFLFSRVIERRPDSYNILSFSAIIILIIDPRQLFDAGFQLSFTAILSLIIIYPILKNKFGVEKFFSKFNAEKWHNQAFKWIVLLFIGTAAAQLGTLPITALMFNKISIVSFFTNLIAIPLSNIALALGFVIVAVSSFSVWFASVLAAVTKLILFYLLVFIKYSANLTFSFIDTSEFNILLLICFYALLVMFLTINRSNYLPRIISMILVTFIFFVFDSIIKRNNNLILTYLDTGRSNCTVARFPEGTVVMFNCGGSADKYLSSERHIIPFLNSSNIGKINLLILTKLNYEDFISLVYLVNNFEIQKLIIPDYYYSIFSDYNVKKKFRKLNIEFISSPTIINKKGNFRIYLWYDSSLYRGSSMQTELIYGSKSFIFNDTQDSVEDYLFARNIISDSVAVLKVPHTGSFNYVSPFYLSQVFPENIVISNSEKSKKNLHIEVFTDVLRISGYHVSKTAEEGAIIYECDGSEVQKVKWK